MEQRHPDFQRLVTALRRQEPDYVPFAEFLLEEDVKAAFLGRPLHGHADQIAFWQAAGYDYYPISLSIVEPGRSVGGTTSKNYSVYAETYTERSWAEMHKGVITTRDEFAAYPWPEINDGSFTALDELAEILPDSMKVVVILGKIFTGNWLFQGAEAFYQNIYDDLELIELLYDKISTLVFKTFEQIIEHPVVGAVWHPDDLAGTAGLLVNPKHYRKYVFPWYKKMGDICRQLDKPMIFHSDGNIWPLMEDIVECGFWGLHPIDPKAMDIYEVDARYGDRLALLGNIDLDFPLGRGTPDDVEQLVAERIRRLAPGGGYILSSGNSIPEFVPLENYQAMLNAGHIHGKYPIGV